MIETIRYTNSVQTYALHDSDKSLGGAKRIKRSDAQNWNSRGYGIFHTVQTFKYRRKVSDLVHINAWAVDLDEGTKAEQWARIDRGVAPTLVIESKNGFHVYFRANGATTETWKTIMEHRLIPFYKADKKAKDLARILRVPGYYHYKDPKDPFLVRKVLERKVEYTERDMLLFYKDLETPKLQKKLHNQTRKAHPMQGDFWDRVWALNCYDALIKLSGSCHVGFETYEFKQNASGTLNIFVNGKSSSCWIDLEGRIGSFDHGGPTIAQWLNYFHKDYVKVVNIIKEVFPECQAQTILL
jgi:hypothetical protein